MPGSTDIRVAAFLQGYITHSSINAGKYVHSLDANLISVGFTTWSRGWMWCMHVAELAEHVILHLLYLLYLLQQIYTYFNVGEDYVLKKKREL